MGALWWWIWELSAREIVETLSEVEVVGDPAVVNSVQTSDLMEIVLDASDLGPLESLRAQRERQRHQPGFGQLVGRTRVYLRREFTEDGENEMYLMDLGPDGRVRRQVVISADGYAVAETPDSWLFNPPFDLYDPEWAPFETTSDDFEAAWEEAIRPQGSRRPRSRGE
jgi:hypothetical protein